MTDPPKITERENGPLVVENPPEVLDANGSAVETKAVAALCRCGASKNKPFCDGTHNAIGFSSEPDHSKIRNKAISYSGNVDGVDVTISYTPVLCTHAAECQARALDVFNPKQKPWIQPENGSLSAIMDVMAACPSGALRVAIAEQPEQHLTTGDVEIKIEKHGPYHVKNVALEADFNGAGHSKAKYSLCRCGASKNKPFCDGSHYDVKWKDDE
ncbi:MAG: CDGSH iron-sulfur domain-containing protein [Pseudomonadota bacterium]